MTPGQLRYEEKRAAKAGLPLGEWLSCKRSRLSSANLHAEEQEESHLESPDEIFARVEREIWGLGTHTAWFHGGIAGLKVGDKLLPGADVGNSNSNRGQWGSARSGLDEVYVTPDKNLALRYAVHFPDKKGAIYRCEPASDVDVFAGQRVILDYLISHGFSYEEIAPRLRIPCLGSETFTCSEAKIAEEIGEPWSATKEDWFAASNLPDRGSDTKLIVRGMIKAGVPTHLAAAYSKDNSWEIFLRAIRARVTGGSKSRGSR
ncbi:hypothetical protein [Bradyrhizobium sp. MOS002]|uniref:hypothetical protein n=1 Tax=Bradyrhizobium sp. MOS002 TaxID=2133947 RepID=UPI000D11865A|nr:hypothetical protein [Bradyrhizobium sp. MOS002]PSO30208.1 hypothetical protein C7G41_19395 [Bradyrhizobium sp. MOS002]